jgi:hypothetical protein
MLRRVMVFSMLATSLAGCAFHDRVFGPGGTQEQWLNYVNSPAYYQDTYRSRVRQGDTTTTCYTTVDRRDGWSDTRCY